MGLKIRNLADVKARISRTESKVMANSLSAMRAMAKLVVEQARKNAPIDTGDLEKAIVAVEERSRNALGQFGQITIKVGVDVDLLDLGNHGGYDYSIAMHEDPNYKLGPRSRIKEAHQSNTVGYKYLQRALDETQDAVRRGVEDAVKRSIN
jgi:hypothetical protein